MSANLVEVHASSGEESEAETRERKKGVKTKTKGL
jgi:hypothetical protein